MFYVLCFLFSIFIVILINRKLLSTMPNFTKVKFISLIAMKILIIQLVIRFAKWCKTI